jgi:hypothetical protein
MRALFLLLAGIVLCGEVVAGDLAIYKIRGRNVLNGNGDSWRGAESGFFIWDLDTNEATVVASAANNAGAKLFTATSLQNVHFENLTGRNGTTYTVIVQAPTLDPETSEAKYSSDLFRGQDANILISPNRKKRFPRVFSKQVKLLKPLGGVLTLLESQQTYTLDSNTSFALNARGDFYQDVVYRYIAYFIARGYTRVD